MEEPAYRVFDQLNNNIPLDNIAFWCSNTYGLPNADAQKFVGEVSSLIELNNKPFQNILNHTHQDSVKINPEGGIYSEKYYQFAGCSFCFQYYHKKLEEMFHPKLAHLETNEVKDDYHTFMLFRIEDNLYLRSDDKLIGPWGMDEVHFFQGKVSAEFLNKVYDRKEEDWIGVFHASALSDGKNSIIMPGESGSGKSTSLAILLANGFDVIADDFVPIEAATRELRLFPSAISIKEGAWDLIKNSFPEFGEHREVHYKDAATRMIFLPPPITADPENTAAPVKAIVFINYSPGAELELTEEPKHIAFQKLVTDSWISPIYENVESFMDWFIELPCYRLTYSDNEQMVSTVRKLFNDEL